MKLIRLFVLIIIFHGYCLPVVTSQDFRETLKLTFFLMWIGWLSLSSFHVESHCYTLW